MTRLALLLALTALLVGISAAAPPAAPPARQLDFAALDGSAWDADGAADGVWTWPEALTLTQPLSCGPASAAGCSIHLAVAGDLELAAGAALDSQGPLEVEVAGELRLGRGAAMSARQGGVEISAAGGISIDGLIAAGPARDGAGAGITIASLGGPGHGVRLGPSATVIAETGDAGGAGVLLSGCGIEVRGLVAALAQGPGATVTMRSCEELVVDGRDLGRAPTAVEGDRLGRIEVRAGGELSRIDLAAAGSVTLDGSELRVGAGPGSRIDVAADRGRISWRGGRGRVAPAAETGGGDRIRLSACEGIALGGTELDPWSELELVDHCAPGDEAERPPTALEVAGADALRGPGGEQATPSCTPDLVLANQTVSTIQEHVACNSITAENYRIIPRGFVVFRAGQFIVLKEGFEVVGSAQFQAVIDPTLNQPPTITSSATPSAAENQTAVVDVESTDPEGDTEGSGLSYAITGGADQAKFSIVAATGVLTFNMAPDFEMPGDANADNVYEVQVTVTDSGGLTDVQDLQVTVTNVNEAPTITSSATPSVPENQTAAQDVESTDPEGDTEGSGLSYAITGGVDQAQFSIVAATGVLTFNMAPDFENPQDVAGVTPAGDNVYELQVTVTDSGGLTDVQDLQVTVTDANDKPTITSGATPSVPENQTAVTDVQSTDDNDAEGSGLSYAITGGVDQARFSIVAATGVLTFNTAPDFENPQDVAGVTPAGDNVYEVQVTVTDSGGLTDVQDLQVTVTNVNEAPTITSGATPSVPENQTAVTDVQSTDPEDSEGSGLSYAITGGVDQAQFSIVAATGVLTFNMAPDFESPQDVAGVTPAGDNVYEVQVTVTDSGGLTDVQNLQVTVTNVNEPPAALPDSFDHVGNTLLLVDKPFSVPAAPEIVVVTGSTFGVLDNDSDPEAAALSVTGIVGCADMTAPFDCPTANGGAVSMESNGRFSFVPKTGDTMASDSFQYNVSDGTNTATGTVTLTRKNRVWYVQNDNASGTDDGSSGDPFDTLAEAETAAAAGDTIYVFEGDGTTTGQDAGITLKDNQRFLGEGVDLTVPDTVNGVAGPTLFNSAANNRAKVTNGAGAGVAASNVSVEIRGLELTGSTSGIDVDASAGLRKVTVTDNTITGTTAGHGIDADSTVTGNLELVFDDNVVVSGDDDGAGTAYAGGSFTAASFTVGSGNLVVTSLADNGVGDTVSSVETGLRFVGVTFDADPSNGTIATGGTRDTVMAGNLVIGDSGGGNRAMGPGLSLSGVNGDLDFTSVDVFNSGGFGIELANAGQAAAAFTLTIDGGKVNTLDGGALDLDPATVDVTLASVTTGKSGMAGFASPSVRLVDLVNGAGGVGVDINGGALAGSSATVFVVGDGSPGSGGTATIAYDGTIADGGPTSVVIQDRSAGAGNVTMAGAIGSMATPISGTILADDNAAGTITFSGAANLSTGANDGVRLTDNAAATVRFTGGLDIATSTGDGFTATGGGTVEVTGASNTIAVSSTGQAVVMSGVTIGGGDVTFSTIDSTGTGANAPSSAPLSFTNVSNLGTFNGGAVDIDDTAGTARGISISGGSADFDFTSATIANTGGDAIFIGGGATGSITFDTVDIDSPGGDGIEINGYTGSGTDNVTISGGTIDDPTLTGLTINGNPSTGGVNSSGLSIDDTGGHGVALIGNNATINLLSTTIGETAGSATTTAGNALDVDGGAGGHVIGGTIVNNAGRAVEVTNRTGGTVNVTANITETGTGINVASNTGGTVAFSGTTKTINTGTSAGVTLSGNTGATVSFTNGGLDIDTTSGVGFSATGGGTVNASGGGNTVTSTAAQGIDIDGMTTGITFASISSTGSGAQGIDLTNLGSSSSFTVTGTTTVSNAADTGSTNGAIRIENVGASSTLSFATTNVNNRNDTGIFIDDMDGTSLSFGATTIANPNNAEGYGIRAQNSSGAITFASATITDTNQTVATTDAGSDGVPDNEGDGDAIFLTSNSGSFTLNGGTLDDLETDGIDIRNSSNVTVSGVTITDIGTSSGNVNPTNDNGIFALNLSGTNLFRNGTISRFRSGGLGQDDSAIKILNVGTSFAEIRVDNMLIDNDLDGGALLGNRGFELTARGAVNGNVAITNSTFCQLAGDGIGLSNGNTNGSGTLDVVIANNTLSNDTTASTGAAACSGTAPPAGSFGGIQVGVVGTATLNLTISGTTLDSLYPSNANNGMLGLTVQGDGNLFLTVDDSDFFESDSGSATMSGGRSGIFLTAGNSGTPSDDPDNVDVTIHNSDFSDTDDEGVFIDVRGSALNAGNAGQIRIVDNNIGDDGFGGLTPVGRGGFEVGTFLRFRNDAKTIHVLVDGNRIENEDNSGGDETLDLDIEASVTVNATITANTLISNGVQDHELIADVEAAGATGCVDLRNNSADDPTPGMGSYLLDNGGGTFNANTSGNSGMVNTSGTIGSVGSCTLPSGKIIPTKASIAQTATVSTAFTALGVLVLEDDGDPASGVTVTFSAPGAGASGTFPSGASCVTGGAGTCSVPFTANATAGGYEVTASATVSGSAQSAKFLLANLN